LFSLAILMMFFLDILPHNWECFEPRYITCEYFEPIRYFSSTFISLSRCFLFIFRFGLELHGLLFLFFWFILLHWSLNIFNKLPMAIFILSKIIINVLQLFSHQIVNFSSNYFSTFSSFLLQFFVLFSSFYLLLLFQFFICLFLSLFELFFAFFFHFL